MNSETVKRSRKLKSAPFALSIPPALPATNTLEFKAENPRPPAGLASKAGRKKAEITPVADEPVEPEEQLLLTPKIKTKRLPSKYNLFVKEHMQKDEVKKLAPKERFSHISKLYKDSKVLSDVQA